MKRFKKFVSLVTAAALFALLPATHALTASAAEPVRHYVKYVESKNEWRYQQTDSWDDSSEGRELYYLKEGIKDGDILVIDGTGSMLNLDLSVSLSNLTIKNANSVAITTKGIQDLYVLKNSVAAINGDIMNAYVYDNATCNLNNNVVNLILYGDPSVEPTVYVGGVVGYAKISDVQKTYYEFYDFEAGSFSIDKGIMRTDTSKYSTTNPAQSQPAPAAPAAQTPAAQAPAASNDYDDVPKTGDSSLYLLLFAASALCFMGSFALKREKR